MKRTDLVQAFVRVLVGHIVTERARVHEAIERHDWVWEKTKELSSRMAIIDHALTQLGWFDTSNAEREP